MKSEIQITKPIAEIIVKMCFDIVEFSRLYEQDYPESAKRIFQCNDDIRKGLKWFIDSESTQTMGENVIAYKKAVKNTLGIYNNLQLSFIDKKKIIDTLNNLHQHLIELEKQIKQTNGRT